MTWHEILHFRRLDLLLTWVLCNSRLFSEHANRTWHQCKVQLCSKIYLEPPDWSHLGSSFRFQPWLSPFLNAHGQLWTHRGNLRIRPMKMEFIMKSFYQKIGWHFATYHFLVSWKIRLLNKWKLIFAQLLLNFDQLSKTPWPVLKRQNNFTSKAFGFHVLDIGLGKRPSFLFTLQRILCARLTGLWTFPNAWRSKERIVDGKCIPQTVGQQRRERRYKSKRWNGNEYRGEPVQKNVCFPLPSLENHYWFSDLFLLQ